MKLTPAELYEAAIKQMHPECIDHHCTDLYLMVTPISQKLIENYEYKHFVTRFKSNIDGAWWYDIPFCYMGKDWRTK